jgi:large subunit ribosomal protein L29
MMMDAKELRTKSVVELNSEVLELRKAQFSLRMQLATQQLSNTSQLGRVRKDIARIKTVLQEKAGSQ